MIGALAGLALAATPAAAEVDALAILIADSLDAATSAADTDPIRCSGAHRQGAALLCQTDPGARVSLGDISVTADDEGWVVIGHDRDAEPETVLRVDLQRGSFWEQTVTVEQREYDIQRIEGTPRRYNQLSEEDAARSRREGAVKAAAYQSRWETPGFLTGFVMPVEGRITGVYGSQRYYNGDPSRPHYGIDIAAPSGTDVIAPADGVVTLANDDMFWEGGLIFIDHGQGFTSAFLHMSGVDVEVGDVVAQGDVIGQVGAGGRSTGAHLDWRIKWHNRYIDPNETLQLDPASLR
ncbi:peptidoglycan DD-metalloendopeptidase family protein [Maricaulaceae bacterium EIL42A08]|nr:peptidoglycan DD-metalloendopeptidase family protein [Maricaulaceae bacterium EIL42A08]